LVTLGINTLLKQLKITEGLESGAWQPSLNISTVLTSIGLVLSEPNPDDGLMCEVSREYKYNRQAFDYKAREMTQKYAVKVNAGDGSSTSLQIQETPNAGESHGDEKVSESGIRVLARFIEECDGFYPSEVNMEYQKWLTPLLGYDFEIFYKPGCENKAADGLSRCMEACEGSGSSLCLAVTIPNVLQIQDIYKDLESAEDVVRLKQRVLDGTIKNAHYQIIEGRVWYKRRLVLSKTSRFIPLILAECHDSKLGGHSGSITLPPQSQKKDLCGEQLTHEVSAACKENKKPHSIGKKLSLGLKKPLVNAASLNNNLACSGIVAESSIGTFEATIGVPLARWMCWIQSLAYGSVTCTSGHNFNFS
ncbi:unnamed protein product, partial [Brassica oleracea var. botrytis]